MTFIKTNIPGYMKDEKTGAVIHTEDQELLQHRAAKLKILELRSLNIKVNKMENDIDDIKMMLVRILDNQKGT